MWTHPRDPHNVERLRREFGYRVVEPEAGPLASGQNGIGRLAELDDIVDAVVAAVADAPIRQPDAAARPPVVDRLGAFDLEGRQIVVSAGGTAEAIDPVRFIGNRSTGRMGIAIVEAALARGARVTLIAGRLEVPVPPGGSAVDRGVDRRDARRGRSRPSFDGRADALVMAAAVADFRPAHAAPTKLTRGDGLTHRARAHRGHPRRGRRAGRHAGSAARHRRVRRRDRLLDRAPEKLRRKGADLLVANDVSRGRLGVRHRDQPGLDPRRRRVARRPAAAVQARGRGPAAGPGREPGGRARTRGRTRNRVGRTGTPAQTGPMSTET